MNISLKFLPGILCTVLCAPVCANVATTAGNNYTAYNGTGAMNNNQWNNLTNSRTNVQTGKAKADFGNCNSVILRCASPKCASGGCVDMSVARPIVAGCVNSNKSCKKHGDELIDTIAAQLVSQSTVKVREQEQAVAIAQANAQAQADAAAAAAAQSNSQMQQMQYQMQQMQEQMRDSMNAMQEQMAAQSESQNAQIQSALAAQQSARESYDAGASSVSVSGSDGADVAQQLAAAHNISPDIFLREQMAGQIETSIEDAVLQMKKLKDVLDSVLEYAGCDSAAVSCTGPKRVKKFKELVNKFFDPYDTVLDSMYESLVQAMSLGIDVNDTIMLLSDSCNIWGKYTCGRCNVKKDPKEDDHKGRGYCECFDKDDTNCFWRVSTDENGKVLAKQQNCRLIGTLGQGDDVLREWIDNVSGMSGATQVACASDVILNASVFKGRSKKAEISIDVLRDLVNQDSNRNSCAKKSSSSGDYDDYDACKMSLCAVKRDGTESYFDTLQEAAQRGRLPTGKDLCKKRWQEEEPTVTKKDYTRCSMYSFYGCPSSCYSDTQSKRCLDIDPKLTQTDTSAILNCMVKRQERCKDECKWDNDRCVPK